MSVIAKIENEINNNDVVLFMKGTPQMPQCGFSSKVVAILKKTNTEYTAINVLEDNEIREGIKVYANWPTIPQLYVHGKFIGGCDIVSEMYEQGELVEIFTKETS